MPFKLNPILEARLKPVPKKRAALAVRKPKTPAKPNTRKRTMKTYTENPMIRCESWRWIR